MMLVNRVIIKPIKIEPIKIRIHRTFEQEPFRCGFAFIQKTFESQLNAGKLKPHMVQLMLHVEWKPMNQEIPPDLEISFIMRNWVRLYEGPIRITWEVYDGAEKLSDKKEGLGVLRYDSRWVGFQMHKGDSFFLEWTYTRNPGFFYYHSFFHQGDQLEINPAPDTFVLPEDVQLFKINPCLVNLMRRLY